MCGWGGGVFGGVGGDLQLDVGIFVFVFPNNRAVMTLSPLLWHFMERPQVSRETLAARWAPLVRFSLAWAARTCFNLSPNSVCIISPNCWGHAVKGIYNFSESLKGMLMNVHCNKWTLVLHLCVYEGHATTNTHPVWGSNY